MNTDYWYYNLVLSVFNHILGIAGEDIPDEAKREKANNISEKIDKQILDLLSKEQTVIYQEMIEDRKD